jgi:hypothetical protein
MVSSIPLLVNNVTQFTHKHPLTPLRILEIGGAIPTADNNAVVVSDSHLHPLISTTNLVIMVAIMPMLLTNAEPTVLDQDVVMVLLITARHAISEQETRTSREFAEPPAACQHAVMVSLILESNATTEIDTTLTDALRSACGNVVTTKPISDSVLNNAITEPTIPSSPTLAGQTADSQLAVITSLIVSKSAMMLLTTVLTHLNAVTVASFATVVMP